MSDSESFETATPANATVEPPANQAPAVAATGARALAIRDQPPALLKVWEGASTQQKIAALIPKELSFDKFKRMVVSLLYRQPELSDCDPVSVFSCISDCATLGLYPDAVSGKVYFIKRFNKKKKANVCTILIGFKGLRDLALESPEILDLWPGVVREGDDFELIRAPRQEIRHKPRIEETGEVIGFYSCAALRSGLTSFEWIPLAEVERTQKAALDQMEEWQRENSPWTLWPIEMGKKTAIRRHFKNLPITDKAREAMVAEQASEERTVKQVAEVGGAMLPEASEPGRPSLPAPRRGGARAAAEPAADETGSQEPAAAEPPKQPAEAQKPAQEAPPVSTPASGRRRGTAPVSAPAAPPPAVQSSPPAGPPASSPKQAAPQSCPPIAPGVTLQSFHGKPWPQVISFEVIEIQPRLAGGTRPYLLLKIKAEGFEGEAVTFECAGVDAAKGAVILNTNLMRVGMLLEANFDAQAKAVKVDGKNVPDYSRPPVLIAKNIGESREPTFG